MVVFEALTWEARDTEGEYIVSIFGRAANGDSVSVSTAFKPYFFVKLAKNASDHFLFDKIKKACGDNAPTSYELLRSKDLWGFQNNELKPFMKLNFTTWAAMKACDGKLRRALPGEDRPLKVFESNLEPILRFMHRSGIQSTGWLETGDKCVRSHLTRCKIDLFCNDWRTLKPVARDDIAPFIVASFDIETNSSTGKFPDANIAGDACFQIAVTLKRMGEKEIYEKVCLCYKKTTGADVVSFDTERDLLIGFRDWLVEHDVDILTGWNIFGFDLEFMYIRASLNGCLDEFSDISKLKDHQCEMVYKKLSSNALGDNTLKLFPMPGRYVFDMFHDVKREHKLDSYSLNFVSEKFLGDRKLDMSPKEMFRRFARGDADELGEVADYCIKDTVLPHMLMDKLYNLLNLLEMAKATWVPISYLTERGQQIKVFSQMTRKAREIGFMVPTIRWGQVASETYEGATVLEAQTGAYYTPITALDFEGLYPSIMIAHNLCYSTLVMDERYANVPGVTYETFGAYKFAQDVSSLLPAILVELKQFRKKAKQDMAAATGDMKNVYNGKQLAYKISMNSVYGFTGAGKGMLPCVPIAATVTMKGRSMIEETKTYVEANFPGAKVRYGDSVTGDTALLLRINGQTTVRRIDDLGDVWVSDPYGKEFSRVSDVETWTERGWTKIQTIIRHETDKQILRVTTHTGSVKVTTDHSLVRPDGSMVSPTDLSVGESLLHSFPDTFNEYDTISEELARLYGFFMGDGSCGYYKNCDKSSWQLNNADIELLNVYKKIILQEYPEYNCEIYDTMKSSGVYKLSLIGSVKKMANEWEHMFYNSHRNKIVPDCILNGSIAIKNAFLVGLYDADGDKVGPGRRIDQKSQVSSLCIFTLLKSLGYNVSVQVRSDKTDIYRLTYSTSSLRKSEYQIKKIEQVVDHSDKFVYDLTTENHHFHAGVGSMIVHNTDSVMVEFDVGGRTGQEAIEYSWEQGEKAAEACTALFKKPNNLELEKVYYPYFLYSKKRYAAKLWTKNKSGDMQMDYIDVKGLQLVRRDNIPFVREVCKELLDVILESKNPEGAKQVAHSRAVELLDGRVPMDKLVLSQKLADTYKSTNLPHVSVVKKMREREPGSEPQSGDRVPFVLVKVENIKKARQFEIAEDPKWVLTHKIPLDYEYYFTNKFMNPVCDLLEPLVADPKESIFGDLLAPKKKSRGKQTDLRDVFKSFEDKQKTLQVSK